MHILLVENNSTDQFAIQRLFQSQNLGYTLDIADSKAQALKCIRIFTYDLILLDHQLDDGTGLELLEHIVDIPVVFIAARSSEDVIIQAMKAGAYDFLVKDPHMDYLAILPSTIDKVLSRKREEDRRSNYIAELERSNAELQNFAFMASHDMKEPLRKIVGFGDLLLDQSKDLSQEMQGYARKMQSSAKRMQAMIDDLLKFSAMATKGEPFRSIDLNKVVQEVIEDLEDSISETNAVVYAKNLPTLEADPIQMYQLFQNLISNSIKFHKKEQIPKVELIATPVRKDSWDINVSDNGIGLDAEYKEKIFQPFVRLHGRSEFTGSGIGLAICERIVTRHKGKIKVSRSNEAGSTFKVTLPNKQDS